MEESITKARQNRTTKREISFFRHFEFSWFAFQTAAANSLGAGRAE